MANKSILERLGLTQNDIEAAYEKHGSLRATSKALGIDKKTLIKYLRHVEKDPTPHKTKAKKVILKIPDDTWIDQVVNDIQQMLLNKEIWVDTELRRIPGKALKATYFEEPLFETNVIPIYAKLRDGRQVILLHFVRD